jgi:hypothetical protein
MGNYHLRRAVIPAGGTDSNLVDITGLTFLGFTTPGAWTAAGVLFTGALPVGGPRYIVLKDGSGYYQFAGVFPFNFYRVESSLFKGFNQMEIRATAAQAAAREFHLLLEAE